MNYRVLIILLIPILILATSCGESAANSAATTATEVADYQEEKAAILEVLNEETKAAFNRDYEGWKEHWVHKAYVTKTYMNFADSTMTETLGWEEVNDYVRTYLEEHPDPVPLPELLDEIEVRLYGTGAWVDYEQVDPVYGLKREARLMEKEDGQWKIAGMQTIIYGKQGEEEQSQ